MSAPNKNGYTVEDWKKVLQELAYEQVYPINPRSYAAAMKAEKAIVAMVKAIKKGPTKKDIELHAEEPEMQDYDE